jgi:hypothetical protein
MPRSPEPAQQALQPRRRVFIVAYKFQDAERLAHQLGYTPGGWTYAVSERDLYPQYGGTLVVHTRAWRHPDFNRIIDTAKSRNMDILFVDEDGGPR